MSTIPTASRAERKASATAKIVALCRAVHALRPAEVRIFDDTLAAKLLGYSDEEVMEEWKNTPLASKVAGFDNCFAVRNRFSEDELEKSGSDQYVILGAGLDSFAYRRRDLCEHIHVFEVDHPKSQEWKQEQVVRLRLKAPPTLHRVPVDFETDDVLSEKLASSGFDPDLPVFVSLHGVAMYLTKEALSKTLREINSLSNAGCTLVMDYMPPFDSHQDETRVWVKEQAKRVAQLGEPWIGITTRDEIASLLRDCGFTKIDFLDRSDIERRYLSAHPETPVAHHLMNLCAVAPPRVVS